ncbi:MAG: cupin domain-containing protein [Cyclobacteriaceae bacterium]
MKQSVRHWIKKLGLQPHPEGGYFRETYRSTLKMAYPGFSGNRNACTGIYFLLERGNFSAFHRIKSDEMWHFYAGDGVTIYVIDQSGALNTINLGLEIDKGEVPQAVVEAGCWFASEVSGNGEFALVGCTVSPGFDFEDFEMGNRADLLSTYPDHSELIMKLTRSHK